jgi:hypothetical protein
VTHNASSCDALDETTNIYAMIEECLANFAALTRRMSRDISNVELS